MTTYVYITKNSGLSVKNCGQIVSYLDIGYRMVH